MKLFILYSWKLRYCLRKLRSTSVDKAYFPKMKEFSFGSDFHIKAKSQLLINTIFFWVKPKITWFHPLNFMWEIKLKYWISNFLHSSFFGHELFYNFVSIECKSLDKQRQQQLFNCKKYQFNGFLDCGNVQPTMFFYMWCTFF